MFGKFSILPPAQALDSSGLRSRGGPRLAHQRSHSEANRNRGIPGSGFVSRLSPEGLLASLRRHRCADGGGASGCLHWRASDVGRHRLCMCRRWGRTCNRAPCLGAAQGARALRIVRHPLAFEKPQSMWLQDQAGAEAHNFALSCRARHRVAPFPTPVVCRGSLGAACFVAYRSLHMYVFKITPLRRGLFVCVFLLCRRA